MLEGAIVGLILVLISSFGGYLSRVVPTESQKSVASVIVVFGILSMLTNIPYSYGMIEQSDELDIVFLVLLFGGALMAAIGLALRIKNRESDPFTQYEKRRVSKSDNKMSILGIVLLFALLVALRLTLFFTTQEKPSPTTFRPPPERVPVSEIESISQASVLLFDGEPSEQNLALKFVIDHKIENDNQRAEIGRTLANAIHDGFDRDSQMVALEKWLCPEMTETLVSRLKRDELSRLKPKIEELFVKRKAYEAAEYLAEAGRFRTLRKMGTQVLPSVTPYLHSKTRSQREAARELVREWSIDPKFLIQKSIDDLRSKKGQSIDIIAPYLLTMLEFADNDQLTELVELTEQIIVSPELDLKTSTVKLLARCAREPETPAAALTTFRTLSKKKGEQLKTTRSSRFTDSDLQQNLKALEKLLRRFPSPEIDDVMLEAFWNDLAGIDYLSRNTSPGLIEKFATLWDTMDTAQQDKIIASQTRLPDAIPPIFDSCLQDLASGDPEKLVKCIRWLEAYQVASPATGKVKSFLKRYRPSVQKSLKGLLQNSENLEPAFVKEIARTAELWKSPNKNRSRRK
jgi:hypothetical protein